MKNVINLARRRGHDVIVEERRYWRVKVHCDDHWEALGFALEIFDQIDDAAKVFQPACNSRMSATPEAGWCEPDEEDGLFELLVKKP